MVIPVLTVLEEFGMTATLFVVTGAVGHTTQWTVAMDGCALPHASWAELGGAAVQRAGYRTACTNEAGPNRGELAR